MSFLRAFYVFPLISLASFGCSSSKDSGPASSTGSTTGAGATTGGTGGTGCAPLDSYVAGATPYTFAGDIVPILQQGAAGAGCGLGAACHGSPGAGMTMAVDLAPQGQPPQTLSFADDPSTILASLMQNSVNNPSMPRVTPSDIKSSMIAYKIVPGALGCVASQCTAGNTIGTTTPCGDPMPSSNIGMLTEADRNMILDWIVGGALP